MKKITFLTLLTSLIATTAMASGPWNVNFQDQKYPSQAALERYVWANPSLGNTTLLKASGAANNGTATTISSFAFQPDVARNIVITPAGQVANIGAGTAVVTGLNIHGVQITENFTVSGGSGAAITGAKAFQSVSSVVFPATTGGNVFVNVGTGNLLGIPRCMNDAGKYVFSEYNKVYETTRGTLSSDTTHVELNVFTPNGTLNGSALVELFYIQNFRCF